MKQKNLSHTSVPHRVPFASLILWRAVKDGIEGRWQSPDHKKNILEDLRVALNLTEEEIKPPIAPCAPLTTSPPTQKSEYCIDCGNTRQVLRYNSYYTHSGGGVVITTETCPACN